jgi:hypothetical protein
MTSESLVIAISRVVERLSVAARQDPDLRLELRRFAEAVLAWTEHVEPAAEHELGVEQAVVAAPPPTSSTASSEAASSFEPLPALTLGSLSPAQIEPTSVAPVYPKSWYPVNDSDLAVIEARCRLKAEGARWAAKRRRLIEDGASFATEIEPMDRDIIARAKEIPDCFQWMCHPSGPSPLDLKLYEDVAGCFEAAADVVSVLRRISAEPEPLEEDFERCLDLLAWAQSALRAATRQIDGQIDSDQIQIYNWLRHTASEQQVFIQRYMRADDPADPTTWAGLIARTDDLEASVEGIITRARQRKKRLGKIRHKVSLLNSDPPGAEEHWRNIVQIVDELVQEGLPPSNSELRDLLLPVIDELPDLGDVPRGFELVLREIDRFLALQPPQISQRTAELDPEIEKVAKLLEGKSLVVIGGDSRPEAETALKKAFRLKELNWVTTRSHQSVTDFEAYVTRPEVAAVLLAIRWTSHSHGDVKSFCDAHDKPFVRLPGGYNPRQVAAQILAQCSERIGKG